MIFTACGLFSQAVFSGILSKKEEISVVSAKELAKYIIMLIKKQMNTIQPEEFDVTPLKLQKLLYYCQGYSLALTGKPAFPEPIEAWKYGPVVNSVYQEYKKYNGGIIPIDKIISNNCIDETTSAIARMVVDYKGRLSGTTLANATHKEKPYLLSYSKPYQNSVIPENIIKEFFAEEILKLEEADDDEDNFWMSAGKSVSTEKLESAIAEI